MSSTKKKPTIKKEEDDQEEETHAIKATTLPPTRAEMKADPKAYRRYVSHLAATVPAAPRQLVDKDDLKNWKDRHLLAATISHLVTVFKNEDEPKEEAWRFYEAWLVVNNTDYADSRFWSFSCARSLFDHLRDGKRKCKRLAAGQPEKKEKAPWR